MAWYHKLIEVAKAMATGFVEGAKAGRKIGGGAFSFAAIGDAFYAAGKTALQGEQGLNDAVNKMQSTKCSDI
jgi:hypothetical protein